MKLNEHDFSFIQGPDSKFKDSRAKILENTFPGNLESSILNPGPNETSFAFIQFYSGFSVSLVERYPWL